MTKVLNGDTSLIKALHSHADDVTSFSGMGGYEKGWDAVSKRWDWAAANLFKGGTVRYENLATVIDNDLAFLVDIERHVLDNGEVQRSLRVTDLFRRENGEWRLVHRHGSPLDRKTAS